MGTSVGCLRQASGAIENNSEISSGISSPAKDAVRFLGAEIGDAGRWRKTFAVLAGAESGDPGAGDGPAGCAGKKEMPRSGGGGDAGSRAAVGVADPFRSSVADGVSGDRAAGFVLV